MRRVYPEIEELRKLIVDIALILLAIIFTFAVFWMILFRIKSGFHTIYFLQIALVLLIDSLAVFRKRISSTIKTYAVLALVTVTAFFDLVYWGLLTSSEIYIVLILIFLFGFVSFKRSAVIATLYILSFIVIGLLYHFGILKIPDNYNVPGYSSKILPWLISTIHLAVASLALFFAMYRFSKAYLYKISSLKASEEKYRSLSESANMGIWHEDNNGRTIFVNNAMCKITGVTSPKDLDNISFRDILTQESKIIVEEESKKRLHGKSSTYEVVFKCLDGSFKNVIVTGSPLYDQDNTVIGSIGTFIDVSEIRKKDIALADSEKKFREMNEFLPLIVFESDDKAYLTYCNQRGYKQFGYSDDDFKKGLSIMDTIVPGDHEKLKANFARLTKGEILGENEYTMIRKDGTRFSALIYSNPVIKDGKYTGLRGVIVDITERKKAEQDLKESEERFRELIFNMINPVMIISFDGSLLFANPAAFRLVGVPQDAEIKGWDFTQFVSPEYTEMLVTDLVRISNDEGPLSSEFKVIRADGSPVWVESIGIKAKYSGADVDLVTMHDITIRKNAEEALRESERWFRELIDLTQFGVTISDMDGRYLLVNRKFQDETGYTADEIIGKTVFETGLGKAFINAELVERELKEKGIIENIETSVVARDGNLIDVYFSSRIIQMNGKPAILSAFIDITDKKRLEIELETHRNHLEELVQQRTEALAAANEELLATNEELFHQREELENILRTLHETQNKLIESEKMASVGLLAAGISHEINNPLNFIQGGLYGIEDYYSTHLTDHKEQLEPLFQIINEGIKRASDIVSSLNHFSRRTESHNEDCNIHNIINNCLNILKNQLKSRVTIKKIFTDTAILVKGNEGKLHQAILNILSNASQSISKSGTISIKTEVVMDDVILTFTDTGCGISPEILPRIFDPFFTTKDPGKGTGLGLSITYNIIKDHLGDISVKSKAGKGTTVTITLPVSK